MTFGGHRRGFRISRHLELKPTEVLERKLERMKGAELTRGNVALINVLLGMLKQRGKK